MTAAAASRPWADELWSRVGITAWDAAAVALSTVVIYLLLVVILRTVGSRALTRFSSVDTAVAVGIGAIAGRATLGYTPTLAAGTVALATLLTVEAMMGGVRSSGIAAGRFSSRAVAVVIDGRPQTDLMRHTHLRREQIHVATRRAGLHSVDEVAVMLLERNGELSVLRRGTLVDPEIVSGVRGVERIPAALLVRE